MNDTLAALLDDLVVANRILAGLGIVDGFGHISVRHPDHPERFFLSRSLAPELVTRDDIMELDLGGSPVTPDTRKPYLERFIHGEIYRKRPDVISVVHSHAPSVVPFSNSSVRLRPICHMGSFLPNGASVFEIRERFGATDMLITNPAQGEALAEVLASDTVVLMRGHGFCSVGQTIPVAVFRAVYTQNNAELQSRTLALGGDVTYLSEDEATLSEATNRAVIDRPWGLWKKRFAPTA
ncbi:MAG: class II aldolase/adducin family protein [Betaproteobacteria bacterium]|nr:class II aldolase/adducin family protein [Betaproteobacteria bacterium]